VSWNDEMTEFEDRWIDAPDGLRLYLRDYAPEDPRLTLLCLHGLTRNSADFADLAERLSDRHRVLVMDQRGRGRSDYDSDPGHYNLGVYVGDVFAALEQLALDRVVLIGTSMGGLMAMLMCQAQPDRVAGVVLNDVGPVVEAEGIRRIQSYVGKSGPVDTWQEAAALVEANNAIAYPDFGPADWLAFARQLFVEEDGRLRFAYDPDIARPMDSDQTTAVPTDLWPTFEAMTGVPTLVVRGALSDILSAQTVAEMGRRHEGLRSVEVPGRGHAPTLTEPEALEAIDAFLAHLTNPTP
jgi:pimeloyl-ACP methyl ester carboxylesterase